QGEPPALEEFLRRFPQHAATLRTQIELHLALAAATGLERVTTDLPQGRAPEGVSAEGVPAAGGAPAWPAVPGYEVLGELGRGGMGVVYRARQNGLPRLVALKVLTNEHANADQLTRFRTEADSAARLQHPNIVQVFEVGEAGGRPFLALEFVDGGNLQQ